MMIATQHSLVARLRKQTSETDWRRFYTLYERPLLAFAASHSLGESDCWDVLQETMIKMLRGGFARFDPAKGAFSAFLFKVAKGCVIDAMRRRCRRESRHAQLETETTAESGARPNFALTNNNPSAAAERNGQMALVCEALEFLIERRCFKAPTVGIFRAVVLEGAEPREVAARHHTSTGNVYEAKRAVLARLRQMLQALDRGLSLEEALHENASRKKS
jgi:RNA polymerase sigma factor (sigma-70 family)